LIVAAAILMAVVAGTLVSAATAQAPARASVAVISGDLGKVASKRVSGGGSTPVRAHASSAAISPRCAHR